MAFVKCNECGFEDVYILKKDKKFIICNNCGHKIKFEDCEY